MRRTVLALVLAAGCSYSPGSHRFIGSDFPAARTRAGCLDVGVGPHEASRDDAPVVTYALGNRCDREAFADLHAVRAWGITADGVEVPLVARDPRRELGRREVAASWAGRAAIEYMPAQRGIRPLLLTVCVDVTAALPGAGTRRFCFDPRAGGAS
ncbi:MAG: hypothetical protein KIT31_36735 [Deltaproteobacteria bacterium]|nr:hypothetical protein [Deltaproteobacteria bacterium]